MLNQETRQRIDSARDILVGKVPDPKAQVEQITTALIYKFMYDMDIEAEELGGEPQFFTNEYEKYTWNKLLDPTLGGFDRLNLYTEALLKMPLNPNLPQLFRNILKDAFLPYRDTETLNLFLKEINSFTYDHSEKLGDAFEYLLSVLGSQGDAGQFRTPRHIIDFIVQAVDPKKEDTVLDPACGTAGFLISAYKHILKANTQKRLGDQLTPDEKKKLMNHFTGYDISPEMVRLSLVNMYLHSFPNPNVFEYDTLTSEERWDETFDVIIANPPFMSPKGGIRPHKRFSMQSSRSEVLFVDYIAEHLNKNGRAGIIVPEGIIFQSGTVYKALRKTLVKKYIYAVVSLPAGVFQPYSGVKTSILLMDKQLAKRADTLLFIKVDNDGFDLGAQRRAIQKNDLTKALLILQEYKQALQENTDPHEVSGLEENLKLALVVDKAKIAKSGDYNLSGERYRESIKTLNQEWPMMSLGDLCKIYNGFAFKSTEYVNSGLRVIRISNVQRGYIEDTDPKYIAIDRKGEFENYSLEKDNILISLTGNVGRVGMIKYELLPALLNQRVGKIQTDPSKALNKYIYWTLNNEIFEKQALFASNGIAQANLSSKWLEQYKIPLPPLYVQEEIVSELENYQTIIDGAKQVVENYKPSLKIDPLWKTMKLGELCRFRNGINYTKDSSGEKIKILGVKDFQEHFYVNNDELEYATVDGELNESDLLKEGNIVFVRSNGNQKLIGRCVLIKSVGERITHSGFTIRLILQSNEIDAVFLTYLLKTEDFRQKMIEGGTGANIKSLNQGILSNLVVPLPSLEDQREIVSHLEQEQKLVDATKKLVEIFEQKIEEKISEVWGIDSSFADNATSMSMSNIA